VRPGLRDAWGEREVVSPQRAGERSWRRSLCRAVPTGVLLLFWLLLLASAGLAFAPTDSGGGSSPEPVDTLAAMTLGLTLGGAPLGVPAPTQYDFLATPDLRLVGSAGRSVAGRTTALLLAPRRRNEFSASAHRLDLRGTSFRVEGRLADVGSHFRAAGHDTTPLAPEEARDLARDKGSRSMDLSAAWDMGEALSLTTTHRTRHVDNPTDENYGLTSSQVAHALQLELSGSTKVRAAIKSEREQWDPAVGKPTREKREQSVELTAGLGGSDENAFSAAVTSLASTQDDRETTGRKLDVHLKLVPVSRLRLQADYLEADAGEGAGQSTTSIGATFDLGSQTQLSAHLKGTTTATSSGSDMGLALAAALGCGRLTSEHKQTQGEAGSQTWLKHTFAGAFGKGAAQTKVSASLQQTRSEGADGTREGLGSLHVDRWLSPALHLIVDWRGKQAGTNAEPTDEGATSCQVKAREFVGGELGLMITQGTDVDEASLRRVELTFSRTWNRANVRLAQISQDGPDLDSSSTAAYVDLRTGDLPAWATSISTAGQFDDAEKYLVRKSPIWGVLDMPFTGYRLWAVHRGGAEAQQRSTLGFAHRRLLAGRYHVQALFEECPEASEGPEKGRPLPLQRSFVEIAAPVRAGVHARVGCGIERSLADEGGRLTRLGFGLWGAPGPLESVQTDVSYESGRWEGAEKSRTSVSLLYTRRVAEEDHFELKLGYSWGEDVGGGGGRDCRLALGYEKPI
jgi:hypothetical protein